MAGIGAVPIIRLNLRRFFHNVVVKPEFVVKPPLETLAAAGTPVLLDFFATWCKPCMAMHPVLDELQAELGGRVSIVRIDVDEYLDLAVEMKVMGVPTFVLVRDGREIWRQPGILTKTSLKKVIEAAEL